MHIVHVLIRIKEGYLSSFMDITKENAANSFKEIGVYRFDILQQQDNPCEFLFVEVYNTVEDQLIHRETEHYKKWRAAVTDMLEKPYTSIKYHNVFLDY
ncbi:putative quinol monooxygenase [Peribacillus simplex]|uniref:putative quinol monooxygenase n=1 Tax=Peribacillus simplex TaxID=1478 RepID=UPI0016256C9D|nr:putative quinol monooxygenase [Peribacillus simplex]